MSFMINNDDFFNLKWALQKNEFMKKNLFNEFQNNPEYLKILDNLILDIKKSGTKNIQEKFIGSPTIFDFHSSIYELEVGNKFLKNNYYIEFYSDKQSQVTLPDFYATNSKYEYEVEVTHLIQDDSLDKLINYLKNQKYKKFPLQIILNMNNELATLLLSPPYNNNKTRIKQIIGEGINEYKSEINKMPIINNYIEINTKMGSINIKKLKLNINNNLIVIGWEIIYLPITNRIKEIVKRIAMKKSSLKKEKPERVILVFIIFDELKLITSQSIKFMLESALLDENNGIFNAKQNINNIGAVIGKHVNKYFVFINPNSRDNLLNPNFKDDIKFLNE